VPWPRLLVWVIAGLTAGVVVAAVIVVVVSPEPDVASTVALWLVLGLPSTTVGLLVSRRRPANPVGALLLFNGLVAYTVGLSDAYELVVGQDPGRLPVWDVVVPLMEGAWMWLYVPVALLMLVFPDGRFLGERWRNVAAALIAVVLAFGLLVATAPYPYMAPNEDAPHALGTLPPFAGPLAIALLPVFLGLLVACAVSMRVRYRRATEPVVRAQLKWFALAGLLLPFTLLLCWVGWLLTGGPDLVLIGLAAFHLAVPVATAVAIFRHDLYDVDRALSGAVTYGLLTTALLAVFTAASVVGGLLLGGRSALVAAIATALTAAALAPLRIRLRRWVDRRFYPARIAGLAAVDDLRRKTDAGLARPERIEEVLRSALRDPGLRLGYVVPHSGELVDSRGQPFKPPEERSTPVELDGRRIGVLVSTATSRELLREIAAASALLVEVVRLRAEVGLVLQGVESSRARLLQASYEERRRLERDLHDGAQQRLVSLGMALRVAQRHLSDGSVDVDGLLDQTVAELGTAVAELRQLAHGLRPASLDDGLGYALAALTQTVPVPVELSVDADAVPDDVATTAYYVASEAIANSVKHARAGRIGLSVVRDDGELQVRVSDDGIGGADVAAGSGLAGLADRVAAAGGNLTVRSPRGRGTTIEAVLPCAS
jgi:signal transduction histidine kinase